MLDFVLLLSDIFAAQTGGLGLAAIQIAKSNGADVIGTAGSAAKRAHLRGLGVNCVASSRSLEFADVFVAQKRRPNIVLNSLTSPGGFCFTPLGIRFQIHLRCLFPQPGVCRRLCCAKAAAKHCF